MKTLSDVNQGDLDVICQFLGTVSWGDSCEICMNLADGRAYLHCRLYILVPCHWEKFEEECDRILKVAERFRTTPGVIFFGEAPEYHCHRITWESYKKGFVVNWTHVANRLHHGNFIIRGLDGIDWWNPAHLEKYKIAKE